MHPAYIFVQLFVHQGAQMIPSYACSALQHWVSTNPQAAQLCDTAPTLFWLLIGRQQMVAWPDAHVEALLQAPRTQILRAVCGVGRPAALRWLSRIELDRGDSEEFATLIDAMRAELHCSRWAKEKVIPIHWVSGALEQLHLQHAPAFYTYCRETKTPTTTFLSVLRQQGSFWRDAWKVAAVLGLSDAEIALNRCKDFTAVRRLHDRWTARLNQRQAQLVDGRTHFPQPPIPGNEQIHPIETLEDLRAEGRLMHHCVAVYEAPIVRRECYIYRMLEPERATVELRIMANSVQVGQVRLAYNVDPEAQTLEAIKAWLLSALNSMHWLRG